MISLLLGTPSFAQPSLPSIPKSASLPKSVSGSSQNYDQGTPRDLDPAVLSDLALSSSSCGDAALARDDNQQVYNVAKNRMLAAQIGSPLWIDHVREATEAGYILAWDRLDQDNRTAADEILNHLTTALAPFDVPKPRQELRAPLAQLAWIKSRLANEEKRSKDDKNLRAKVLRLTEGFREVPSDFGPLAKMRILALWSAETWDAATLDRSVACDLAREMERRVRGTMLYRLLECDLRVARILLAAGRLDEAMQAHEGLKRRFHDADLRGEVDSCHRMILVQSYNTLVEVGVAKKKPEDTARAQLAAAELLIASLKDTTFIQQYPNQIWEAFSVFSNVKFKDIPQFGDARAANTKAADIFAQLLDASEPIRSAYIGSKSVAALVAETASLAASAKSKLNEPLEALGFANRGLEALENIKFLGNGQEYSEMGTVICRTNGRALEALIQLERTDEATAAFAKLKLNCGEWLNAYPWDFYSRQHLTEGASKLGRLLAKTGRTTEALPVLRYASDWGVKDASSALAGIYRALPTSPENSASADLREALATRQSMKRFTVPTDFAGVKWQFHVYVSEFGPGSYCPADRALKSDEQDCIGFRGIDDQVTWLEQAKGGMVPADVVSSFQKLSDIARENKVSFPDLVEYALETTRSAGDVAGSTSASTASAKEAAAIHAEMLRTNFWRNPYRALDEGGLALRGYDPVSYTQGTQPKVGLAAHFALWDGALWLFASAENRAAFLERPEFFSPQYGGFCSVCLAEGSAVYADPFVFVRQGDRLFLLSNEGQKEAWIAGSTRLVSQAELRWAALQKSFTSDRKSDVADAILKIGPVRGPSDFELTRSHLARRTLLIERLAGNAEASSRLVSALGNRSWTYVLLNRPKDALVDAERALAFDPKQPWIIGNKANALLLLNRADEAISLFHGIKEQLGPDEETPMCSFIHEDLLMMRDNNLLSAAIADRVLAEVQCEVRK